MRRPVPDGEVNQQSGRDVHIVHDAQRPGIHLGSAVVPHKVSQPRGDHAKEYQNSPLQRRFRHFVRVAERRPADKRHDQRPEIEPGEGVVLGHWPGLHQPLVAHHADSEANIGELDQQQAGPEMVGDLVIANDPGANHRQQGAEGIAPAQAPPAHQIVNQGNVERRQHGEQQQFGDRQIEIGAEAQHVHHAELHRPHQHIEANGFDIVAAGAQKRQKNQRRQADARQHGEIAVHVSGKVLAKQAEREGPQQGSDDQ
ncbi:hypothetical protein ABW09_21070 [Pluralibacter gergoviae]|nr:hypothetical protein ABW09_21070 [Pluralibacter gergoviae]